MRVQLQIKKSNLEAIKSGRKKKEWRSPSVFNKRILFCPRESDGWLHGNPDITEIEFINGYRTEREKLIVQCLGIRMVRFHNDTQIPEDNFEALAGQFAIEVSLGEIIQ